VIRGRGFSPKDLGAKRGSFARRKPDAVNSDLNSNSVRSRPPVFNSMLISLITSAPVELDVLSGSGIWRSLWYTGRK